MLKVLKEITASYDSIMDLFWFAGALIVTGHLLIIIGFVFFTR